MTDLFAHVREFSVLETTDAVTLGMAAGPVAACDFDSFSSSVDDFHALGGKWELDSLDIEERGL